MIFLPDSLLFHDLYEICFWNPSYIINALICDLSQEEHKPEGKGVIIILLSPSMIHY